MFSDFLTKSTNHEIRQPFLYCPWIQPFCLILSILKLFYCENDIIPILCIFKKSLRFTLLQFSLLFAWYKCKDFKYFFCSFLNHSVDTLYRYVVCVDCNCSVEASIVVNFSLVDTLYCLRLCSLQLFCPSIHCCQLLLCSTRQKVYEVTGLKWPWDPKSKLLCSIDATAAPIIDWTLLHLPLSTGCNCSSHYQLDATAAPIINWTLLQLPLTGCYCSSHY